MNIARISPINFNGYLKFKYSPKDNPDIITTGTIDAVKVGRGYRYDYDDNPLGYRPMNMELYIFKYLNDGNIDKYTTDFRAQDLITEDEIKDAYNSTKGNKSKAQEILNNKVKEKYEALIEKRDKWITDALATTGDVECPFDLVFKQES